MAWAAKNRGSSLEVVCKKGVLENFAKYTGKHLCQSLFFNKVAGLRPETLLKKRLWRRCFLPNFANSSGGRFWKKVKSTYYEYLDGINKNTNEVFREIF